MYDRRPGWVERRNLPVCSGNIYEFAGSEATPGFSQETPLRGDAERVRAD
jgi:hypothetical protein